MEEDWESSRAKRLKELDKSEQNDIEDVREEGSCTKGKTKRRSCKGKVRLNKMVDVTIREVPIGSRFDLLLFLKTLFFLLRGLVVVR